MLTMRQKKAVTRELRDRYQRASKKEKTMRLNEFIQLTRYICSKRLAPFLSEIIPVLEKHGEINLTTKIREKLFKISAAPIDRLLADTRKRYRIIGRSTTRNLTKEEYPH